MGNIYRGILSEVETGIRSITIGTSGTSISPNLPVEGYLDKNDALVEPSVTHTASISWRMGAFWGEDARLNRAAFIDWRDVNGDFISRSMGGVKAISLRARDDGGSVTYGWGSTETVTADSPPNAVWAAVGLYLEGPGFDGYLDPSWSFLVDRAILVIGSKRVDFFDGSSRDTSVYTYFWEGEEDRSPSMRVGEKIIEPPKEIVDPNCPPPPEPPGVPGISLDCRENIDEWRRVWYVIPTEEVYEWGAVLPTFEISSGADDVDSLRISLWGNPDDLLPQDFDDTSAAPVGRWNVGYLPANSTMTLDGTTQTVTAQQLGGPIQNAGYLVTGHGNGPVAWPELICGDGYLLAIDTPLGDDPENISLTMTLARRFG